MRTGSIIFDRMESVVARAVAAACMDQGCPVISAAQEGDFTRAMTSASDALAVVFDTPACNEGALLQNAIDNTAIDALTEAVFTEMMQFLSACKTALQVFMPRKRGQIWALCIDDVAAEVLGAAVSPIANQARIGCLKSLAKEYGRMGISFNAVVAQPPREAVAAANWQAARERLKVYALRYTPRTASSYGTFIAATMQMEALPVNGGTLYLGLGVMEIGG